LVESYSDTIVVGGSSPPIPTKRFYEKKNYFY